jgi:hypothetical protein
MIEGKDGLAEERRMQTMSLAPPDETTPPRTPDEEAGSRLDAELDQTMDASDPPSATQPGGMEEEVEAHPS